MTDNPQISKGAGMREWQQWLAENEQLCKEILERRNGVPIDVDAAWRAARADLEDRDAVSTRAVQQPWVHCLAESVE